MMSWKLSRQIGHWRGGDSWLTLLVSLEVEAVGKAGGSWSGETERSRSMVLFRAEGVVGLL